MFAHRYDMVFYILIDIVVYTCGYDCVVMCRDKQRNDFDLAKMMNALIDDV